MKKKILQLSLENAIEFNGKADHKSVINKIVPTLKDKSKISSISKLVRETISKVNDLAIPDQIKKLKKINPSFFDPKEKIKKEIIDLPNVRKIFRVRSAPSASGTLHIGHALVLSINTVS